MHLYTDSRTAIRLLLSSGVETAFTSISFFVTCAIEMISTAGKELFFNLFHVLLRRDLNEIAVSHLPCLRKLVKHHNEIVLLIRHLVQKVTQDKEDVNFKRGDLGHHLSRVKKLLLGDFKASGAIGGIEVDLLEG